MASMTTQETPPPSPARGSVKALPGSVFAPGPGSLESRGWNLAAGDLPLPVLALRRSAVDHNVGLMARWCRDHDVVLAPHGKTTMMPELFRRQLAAGAWAMTVATPRQAEAAVQAGAERILIANQPVDPVELRRLTAIAGSGHEVYVFADSVDGVRLLDQAAAENDAAIRVFVELGYEGGRTGVRGDDAFHEVLDAVGGARHLELAGVSAFEGSIPAMRRRPSSSSGGVDPDPAPVRRFLAEAGRRIRQAQEGGHLMGKPMITAGGSAWFDLVVEQLRDLASLLVLRSGCYVTHDHGFYALQSPLAAAPADPADPGEPADADRLRPALGLWAHVQSTPEPGLAIVGFGRRDANDDLGSPRPLNLVRRDASRQPVDGWRVDSMWDQHARLRASAPAAPAEFHPGDVIEFGISHPCTALDKWRSVVEIDDDDAVLAAWETWF